MHVAKYFHMYNLVTQMTHLIKEEKQNADTQRSRIGEGALGLRKRHGCRENLVTRVETAGWWCEVDTAQPEAGCTSVNGHEGALLQRSDPADRHTQPVFPNLPADCNTTKLPLVIIIIVKSLIWGTL